MQAMLNIMWQSGWEGSLGKNVYMYMYDWVPSMFTWNYQNIVNKLCECCLLIMSNSLWLLCPWDSPSKNTGVGCHFLLQGIFPTREQTHISWVSCNGRWILCPIENKKFFFFFKRNNASENIVEQYLKNTGGGGGDGGCQCRILYSAKIFQK